MDGNVMTIAVEAVGEEFLGPSRAAMAAFLLGLLLTFLGVRVNTRLIRAKVSWWFHDIESGGGVHVHHMVIGVVLMVTSGVLMIGLLPQGLWLQVVALFFGAGVALTLDEFALILRLQDVYWTKEGRLSVNAVFVAICGAGLLLLGVRPVIFDQATAGESALTAVFVVSAGIVMNLSLALICLFKGKLWTGFFALFIPVIGWVGAIRLARPQSPWAHRRYRDRPGRLARAERRERRRNATVDAWRTAFFDLVAGKPHLPSVIAPGNAVTDAEPQGGPAGQPSEGPAPSTLEGRQSDDVSGGRPQDL
jgi:lysyl-tRNA synthetase class 2